MVTAASARHPRPAALDSDTMCGVLLHTFAQRGDAPALRTPDDSVTYTFAEALREIRAIAAGLHAAGVRRGDAVGLMMANRPEFHLVDAAAMLLGATPFSVYNTSPPDQVGYVMGDAGNRIAIVGGEFAAVVAAANEHGARVERIVNVDEDGLAELVAAGDAGFDLEEHARAVTPDDLLTLIYTSGTTGPPKGVEVTHRGMIHELRGMHAAIPLASGGRQISFLPSAHIADRWSSHYAALMTYGATITALSSLPDLFATVARVRPTGFGAVPRVWEKLKAGLEAKGVTKDTPGDAVRRMLGFDECRWFCIGAAPTPVEVLEFFDALGIRICEVWGMSETSCCVTTVRPDAWRPGSVGLPLDGMELRIADDGELLVRGPLVMRGYRNQPERTAEAIDPDGWLHTGDVARVDEDGFWYLIDRKKELIINAAGKNMSPANIESQLKAAGPLIGQACTIGDRRPYNVALLVLDPEAGAGLDPNDPEVLARVQAEVDAANAKLARVEQIKRFALLDAEWLPGGDELTPTMKLKRKPIAEKYAARIEGLYA